MQLFLFYLAITVCLSSCQKAKENNTHTSQVVIISGTLKHPEMTSSIGFLPQSSQPISSFNQETFLKFTKTDSIYSFRTDCNRSFGAFIAPKNSLMQSIFISPGDSLTFIVETIPTEGYMGRNIILRFSGKNAAHYNYSFMADSAVQRDRGPQITKYNMTKYKNNLEKYRDERLSFLEKYATLYSISDEFYDFAKSDIINNYIYSLYIPLGNNLINRGELPEDYFDQDEVPSNRLLRSYGQAMKYKYLLSNIHSLQTEGVNLKHNSFEAETEKLRKYIISNFEGEQRDYLYSNMVSHFVDQQNIEDYVTIKEMIDDAPKYVSDSALLNFIKEAEKVYKPFISQIADNILLNTKLKSYEDNQTYSLKEIFDKHKRKAIYLDFWASWCGPCLIDIKNSGEVKQFLQSQDITYIYISIKDKETAWRNTVKQNNITTNQYLLLDSETPNLISYYKIDEIPRYILLNKRHEVIDSKAPRPIPEMKNIFIKKTIILDRD